MKSIDQQIKTAMAKKVVGRTTPGIPSRGAGSTPRCANRTRTGKSIPIPACRSGAEGFNSEFSNSHFDDLLVASLLGTRQRIAFKYNNGVVDSEITAVDGQVALVIHTAV